MRYSFFPSFQRLLTIVIITLGVVGYGTIARADSDDTASVLALDADLAAPLSGAGLNPGGGGALRFGRKYSLVLLSLTPELGVGYHRFRGASDTRLYRGFLGGRFGVGTIVEPSVFAHVGIGRLVNVETARFSPTFDVGAALDFTLLPLLDLGAHVAYNSVFAGSGHASLPWISAGVHAALVF